MTGRLSASGMSANDKAPGCGACAGCGGKTLRSYRCLKPHARAQAGGRSYYDRGRIGHRDHPRDQAAARKLKSGTHRPQFTSQTHIETRHLRASHKSDTQNADVLAQNATSRRTRRGPQAFRGFARRRLEQGCRRNLQRRGQNEQCVECRIGRTGLATGHVGSKETRVVGELFLRHAAGRTQLFDAQSEGNARGKSFHTMMLVRMHLQVHTL